MGTVLITNTSIPPGATFMLSLCLFSTIRVGFQTHKEPGQWFGLLDMGLFFNPCPTQDFPKQNLFVFFFKKEKNHFPNIH